jgi:hypothetical protein
MMNKILAIAALLILPFIAIAQSGFIYGTVTTVDDDVYTGQIRWGGEETYWFDHFNGDKKDNPNLKYLSKNDLENMRNEGETWKHNISSFLAKHFDVEVNIGGYNHVFVAEFGDIESIRITGNNQADVVIKNGVLFEVDGGSNDLGANVEVWDNSIGRIELPWHRIQLVSFQQTPPDFKSNIGEPIYGTVETSQGSFNGFIQCDHDERVTTAEIDGRNNDGEFAIPFSNIKSIEQSGNRSILTLRTDKRLTLHGTNDVNRNNRGIIVNIPNGGRIDIQWNEFRLLTVLDTMPTMKNYNDYTEPKRLSGTLKTTDGETYTGSITYDLDEAYDFEMLDGNADDIKVILPFRKIDRIARKNYNYADIYLKDGSKILLGDLQDVSESNHGFLVFEKKDDPVLIFWNKMDYIDFK